MPDYLCAWTIIVAQVRRIDGLIATRSSIDPRSLPRFSTVADPLRLYLRNTAHFSPLLPPPRNFYLQGLSRTPEVRTSKRDNISTE